MLLEIGFVRNLGLELLSPVLVPELSDVSSSFFRLSHITRLDDVGTAAKGAETAPARNKRRVAVGDETTDEAGPRIGILRSRCDGVE